MKLSDLERFAIDSSILPSGRMGVSLTLLDSEKVNGGNQRSLSTISITSSGKNETVATQAGIDKCLDLLEKLQGLSEIVKFGVISLEQEGKGEFVCTSQLGLFEKDKDGTADCIVKKTVGFGSGKDADTAERNALKSALSSIGENL